MSALIKRATSALRLEADPANLVLRSVISTADPDRAGDMIVPAGLRNADEYLRNPVVLWAHQRTLPPIGTCQRLEVQGDRVIAETKFAAGSPFAEDVFRLYEQGVLRAWSIGFVPRRSTPTATGLRITEWDLLEYSAVPVPENPAALTLAIQKGVVTDEALCRWLRRAAVDVFAELVA
ncbi:MAG: HK97 family phage prohead protease [Gemmataceae bacterium]